MEEERITLEILPKSLSTSRNNINVDLSSLSNFNDLFEEKDINNIESHTPIINNKIDNQALVLARLFIEAVGTIAKNCRRRSDVYKLYICTFLSWAPDNIKTDQSLQRSFSKVLFAIAHGLKLVRVVNGRKLIWSKKKHT